MAIKENNVLDNDYCFSKTLKNIDYNIKFKNNRKKKFIYIMRQLKKKQKEKEELIERKKNHEDIVQYLKRADEENQKLNKDNSNKILNYNASNQINLFPTKNKNKFILPNISKKEEQENKKNKIIIFEKIWNEKVINKNKKFIFNKNNNSLCHSNKTMNGNNYIIDIFDENYDQIKKKKQNIEKKMIMERIKYNNMKVKRKLKFHQDIMSKIKDRREYAINYSAIEKHMPEVNLNTKSQRIFPIQFVKKNNIENINSNGKKIDSIPKKKFKKSNLFYNLSKSSLIKSNQDLFESPIVSHKKYLKLSNRTVDKVKEKENSEYLQIEEV